MRSELQEGRTNQPHFLSSAGKGSLGQSLGQS
jgi:hypothetical protein